MGKVMKEEVVKLYSVFLRLLRIPLGLSGK